jgi:hypothetical protein
LFTLSRIFNSEEIIASLSRLGTFLSSIDYLPGSLVESGALIVGLGSEFGIFCKATITKSLTLAALN